MKSLVALALLTSAASAQTPGVASEARAKMNYMLSCQGCHQADGVGSASGAPSMVNEVARFLGVDGGREYLTRVPGVANAALSDSDLAELLNWTLATFDRPHLPDDFAPFSPQEVKAGRAKPLISDAAATRAVLRGKFNPTGAPAGGGE